jgi:fumarate reductase subunit C
MTEESGNTRVYRKTMPPSWWTRKAHYFWYVVREFSALPLAIWLLLLLGEIRSAANGPAGYHPLGGTGFVIFSVIALFFSLYHSYTFLSLSGAIIHFKVIDRQFPSWPIVWAQMIMWAIVSAFIIWALWWFAT